MDIKASSNKGKAKQKIREKEQVENEKTREDKIIE